jgi:WD40 repeat protein
MENRHWWIRDIYFNHHSNQVLIQTGPFGAVSVNIESGDVSRLDTNHFTKDEPHEHMFGVFWRRNEGASVSSRSLQVVKTFYTPLFFGETPLFSPNLKRIAIVNNYHLTMWDAEKCGDNRAFSDNEIVSSVSFNNGLWGPLPVASFSPDSKYIAVGSGQKCRRVEIFEVESGSLFRQLDPLSESVIKTLTYSKNGDYIAAGSLDNKFYVWNAKTGENLHVLEGHENAVTAVTFSKNGRRLFTGSRDGSIKIWSTRTGKLLNHLKGPRNPTLAYSPDGNYILSGGADDRSIMVWALAPVLLEKKFGLQDKNH